MNSILITPRNAQEFQLIADIFSKMKIKTKVLSFEEKEDIGMIELMKQSNRNKKVTRESIMKKLRK
ncbi:MAG: hypothetical protein WCT77_07195 [Bacteroidota bacterium]|jgi:hypothetical protein